ncbi:carcinine transporter isoform X2 [Agrilus planipennis]|nr:carcinine transporter isoform X2 [Agrilus planipennis]XP_025830477.1 carcinine transporter isoform X2 [Agrilus planipennis]XP_025830478.1 carcinine transporter isoform X2 [Agrilus planipennis]
MHYSKCKMFSIDYNNASSSDNETTLLDDNFEQKQIPCKYGWNYDRSKFTNTVVMDWDLVCENDFSVTLALVLFGVGGLIGNYIFGYAQDRLGRKPSFYIYLTIQSIFGFATTFATNYYVWIAFRVGVGFTVPAILGTPYVLAIELVGPRYRTLVTILINIAYSLALVSLAIIVWAVRDWRNLSLTTTLPFLLLFTLYKLLPESPRWLLAQGRYRDAEKILSKIARINGRKLPVNYIKYLKVKIEKEKAKEKEHKKIYGVRHLFQTPNLRIKTLIVTFIWFTNTSVYVGLSYYAPVLGGDEFLNFFLAGAVELPTYLFLWPSMETWGRRWTLCVSMIVGGSACLATFLVRHGMKIFYILYIPTGCITNIVQKISYKSTLN